MTISEGVVARLTDFQRNSVAYILDRFHGDQPTRRFLLADEVGMVRAYPCPLGIIHGRYERTVRLAYLESLGVAGGLWRSAIQLVDEANHFTQYDAPVAFNALVAAFVAEHG